MPTVTDLTGTTWRFGECLVSDYTTSFNYAVTATYNVVCDNPFTATYDHFKIYVTNGNYYCLCRGTNTDGIYYGYKYAPQVTSSLRDGFLYTEVTFTGGDDATNADLIAWLESNATLVVDSAPSEITYNGSVIASIESGQTATLDCAGEIAKTDISIAFGTDGSITYGESVTEVVAGKTATLTCAGKKMVADVIIATG